MCSDTADGSTDVASVATHFVALWRAGDFQAAGERYWADDIVSVEPHDLADGTPALCRGIDAVRAKTRQWLATHGIEDLSLDGPFITGDRFAVFADMLVAHAGRRTPHSQIAVFVVRDGRISEEHHFYD
jgi:hypothetical protein